MENTQVEWVKMNGGQLSHYKTVRASTIIYRELQAPTQQSIT